MSRKFLQALALGLAAAAAALGLWRVGALDRVENVSWDWRVRLLAHRGAATEQAGLVFLDQDSLDWAKEAMRLPWPWPREVYAPIVSFCRRGGAQAIVFDVVYTEPSYRGVEDDQVLGAEIAQTPAFVGSVFLGKETGGATNWPAELRFRGVGAEGLDAFAASPAGRRLTAPLASFSVPELATNCAVLGNVSGELDPDATLRRLAPFRLFDGKLVPALGLAAYLAGHPTARVRAADGFFEIDNHRIPVDREGKAILRFRGPSRTHATVSAQAVLQSEIRIQSGEKPVIDPSLFTNRYVFFGFTATALLDLKSTPVDRIYPGVEVHATLLDNLLSGDLLRDAPVPWTVALTALLALCAASAGRACRNGWQTVLAFATLLPLPFAAGLLGYRAGWWIPVAPPEAAVVLGLVGAVILNYATEGRQKRFIRGAFRQYLSPVVIDQLVRDPDQLKLGGQVRELTLYFSDIKGFTGISEKLAPEQLTGLLNEYLTAMTDTVMESGGTIDKYIGDAVVAFWNAPLDVADHALRGVTAALQCQRRLDELRPDLAARYGHELRNRIGVNTGPVVVGNMGSNQRFNYTFLGDAGNLASRLEGINKYFGTWTLITEFTHDRLAGALPAREIARVQVVGRAQPVRIFEPMFPEERERRGAALDAFAAALALFYAGNLDQALRGFEALRAADPAADAYARRCADLLKHPPAQWDGVWVMTEK